MALPADFVANSSSPEPAPTRAATGGPVSYVRELAGSDVEIVETPTTVWLLDHAGSRYARVSPPAGGGEISPYAIEWQACRRIEHDPQSGTYALYLDDDGRRVLRFR